MSTSDRPLSHRILPALILFALAVAVGLATTGVAVVVADMTKKKLIMGLAAGAAVGIAAYTKRPKELLLIGWVLALGYGRMYYSFDRFLGNNGSQGLYWIPADLPMIGLFALWGFESIFLRRRAKPKGATVWPWFAPFMIACILSALGAQKMNWALFECVRVFKFGLMLYYFRYNLDGLSWRVCIVGLAVTILIQGSYGSLQVATQGRIGSLLGGDSGAAVLDIQEEQEGQWHRAAGTLGHPNIFGPFMLMVSPMFLGLGLAATDARLRIVFLLTAMCGLVAAVLSLSRMCWMLTIFELVMMWFVLVARNIIPIRWAVGLTSLSLLAIAIALAPFAEKIERRLMGDLNASIEFRAHHDAKAIEVFEKSPYFGIGLSNYLLELVKYEDGIEDFLIEAEVVRLGLGIRVIAAVHNLYLLLLSETGFIGLTAFFWFLFGVGVMSYRAIRYTPSEWSVGMSGLAIGIVAAMMYQISEFSLWVDPVFFEFALAVGILNAAPYATSGLPPTNEQPPRTPIRVPLSGLPESPMT